MAGTVDQDGLAPTRKVAAAGAGGAASIVLVFALGELGVDVPPEVASAITVLIGFVAGYFKREMARTGIESKIEGRQP